LWKESEITDEYMTGGIVVVLGKPEEILAGMSGGIVYILM
jgi:glutamate synthase domain-containing protein 3